MGKPTTEPTKTGYRTAGQYSSTALRSQKTKTEDSGGDKEHAQHSVEPWTRKTSIGGNE